MIISNIYLLLRYGIKQGDVQPKITTFTLLRYRFYKDNKVKGGGSHCQLLEQVRPSK